MFFLAVYFLTEPHTLAIYFASLYRNRRERTLWSSCLSASFLLESRQAGGAGRSVSPHGDTGHRNNKKDVVVSITERKNNVTS